MRAAGVLHPKEVLEWQSLASKTPIRITRNMENAIETDERKVKVLSSRYVSRRPWLTARCESLELPDGRIVPEYYVLEYPDWVNTIALTEAGEFVFVRQYRHGLGITEYELCAGVCEPDDPSPLEAARRELLEETGFGAGHWQSLMCISANPSTQNNLTHCFLATGVRPIGRQRLDATEDLSVHLLSLARVRELLLGDVLKQATHVAPLWKYFAENGLL